MDKNTKKNGFNGRGPNAMWILVLLVVSSILYLFWVNSANRDIELLSYSKLLTAVEADKVASINVQDHHAHGKFKNPPKTFFSYVIPTEKLWETLRQHNVDIQITPPETQPWGTYFFLACLLFIVISIFMYFKQSQGNGGASSKIFSVGKSRAKFFSPNTITTTFKDVAGMPEVKEELRDIIDFLKNPEKFDRLGAKIPRGVLLNGAPGNGKTMLAKAVAGEASVPFFSVNGSDFVEVFVGVGASRVRDLFVQAKRHSPCIVFIDEIDAVGRQRGVGLGGGNDEREQTLNQLLSEMDGFSTEHGAVIVLAATNRSDVLDKALLRPGRFDRIIEVPYPDLIAREEILRVHARNIKLDPEVDLMQIARGTPGFSGADLANLLNEAALQASKSGAVSVKIENFEIARDKIILGTERKTMVITPKDRLKTAYHEAGHALLNVLLPETDPLHKVTIMPRGKTLGASWSMPERDKYSVSKNELLARIVGCFGGYLAEKIVFDNTSTGVANDIQQASRIARAMVCHYGMSALGPIDFEPRDGQDKEISDKMAQRIDEEVEKIVHQCCEKGQAMLTENRDKLDLLAQTLVERETMQAKEVYQLLGIEPRETHSLVPE